MRNFVFPLNPPAVYGSINTEIFAGRRCLLMSDIYSLRLYDTELMRFSLEKRGLEGLVAQVLSVQREKSHLMPLELDVTGTGIIRWL